jgi:hypothetical protein
MRDFEVRPLNDALLLPAFDLATAVFVERSSLHKSLGIDLGSYRAYLWPSFHKMAQDGLSFVAVDTSTNRIIGVIIGTDYARFLAAKPWPAPAPDSAKPADENRFAPITALSQALGTLYQRKTEIPCRHHMLVDMAAVDQDASHKGIYQALRARLTQHAKSRGFSCVVGELSSAATQHVVLQNLQHENCAEIAFAAFQHNGDYPFRHITAPQSIILAVGRLA